MLKSMDVSTICRYTNTKIVFGVDVIDIGKHWTGSLLIKAMDCYLTWNNPELLSIGPIRTNFIELLNEIHMEISPPIWWSFCQHMKVLIVPTWTPGRINRFTLRLLQTDHFVVFIFGVSDVEIYEFPVTLISIQLLTSPIPSMDLLPDT